MLASVGQQKEDQPAIGTERRVTEVGGILWRVTSPKAKEELSPEGSLRGMPRTGRGRCAQKRALW